MRIARHWIAAALPLAGIAPPAMAKPVDCRVRHVQVDASSLAYEDCGKGRTVLIHPGGPGLDARYMLGFARTVAGLGYRAVLFEPRGTGRSRPAIGDGGQLTVAGSVADLEALRKAVGIDRVILVGHSFGGVVVQAYASAHPDHIARLVLLDSAGPSLGKAPSPVDGWRKQLQPAELARYDAYRAQGDKDAAMRIKFLGSFYHRARGIAFLRSLDRREVDPRFSNLSQDYTAHYGGAGARPENGFQVSIISGDMDWIRGYEPALLSAYPGAKLYLIPHAGHFPWIDAPEEARAPLRDALKGAH
jgi:pimeloyl-ACP methyl ester carboxylesterase